MTHRDVAAFAVLFVSTLYLAIFPPGPAALVALILVTAWNWAFREDLPPVRPA